ncbi:hypothetical protein AB4277_00900 [Vibrio splendidus]|uniref:hypothetical protein n=1 Tax=Vibrio sp. A2-1 TaxID=2912252 RepID=UPI001F490B76|nr:hypothetical protein [Vibrio sp. A2-1]MCF7486757.1 hypothetical protein [Vibrio sp. A2-1]
MEEKIALGALVIASCSFALTIYQAWLSRLHNRMQVKPYIDLTWVSTLNDGFKCSLKNYGVGPAYVEKVNYYLDGKKYQIESSDDFKGLILDIGLENTHLEVKHCQLHKHSALSSSEEINLFEFNNVGNKPYNKADILNCLQRISVTVNYECSYGLKFTSQKSSF